MALINRVQLHSGPNTVLYFLHTSSVLSLTKGGRSEYSYPHLHML